MPTAVGATRQLFLNYEMVTSLKHPTHWAALKKLSVGGDANTRDFLRWRPRQRI